MAVVALREQRVTIYDAKGRMLQARVSSGKTGYETPAGIYSILQKRAEHYSNLYDDASMPFMQRITWSGIAFHVGALPGYPASHGCVRLPHQFGVRLFELSKIGMRVIVVPTDVSPVDIAHPALFRPRPIGGELSTATRVGQEESLRSAASVQDVNVPPPTIPAKRLQALKAIAAAKAAEAEAATKKADAARATAAKIAAEAAQADKALRLADAGRQRADAQLKNAESAISIASFRNGIARVEEAEGKARAKATEALAQLEAANAAAQPKKEAAELAQEEAKAAEAAKVAAVNAAKLAAARMSPVSVFISRQTQRLYVRQGFQPIFEGPVTFQDAEKPIGTHVYTALDYINDGADVRWSVLSMTKGQSAHYSRALEPDSYSYSRRVRRDGRTAEPVATDVKTAKAALDRVAIPQDAMERIAEVVSAGSSLIISDEGLSKETGKGTDFVVLMSGEPQGGIKIRQRPQPWQRDYDRPSGRSHIGRNPFFWW